MELLQAFTSQFKNSFTQKDNIICMPFHLHNQSSEIHFLIEEMEDKYIISTQCHDLIDHLAWNMGDINKYIEKINEICDIYKIEWNIDNNIHFSYICKKEEIAKGIFYLINALSLIGHLGYSLFIAEK